MIIIDPIIFECSASYVRVYLIKKTLIGEADGSSFPPLILEGQ